MGAAGHWTGVAASLVAVVFLANCRCQPSGTGNRGRSAERSSTRREKGANEAAEAIAAGKLKLKEYPALPSPPGHQEFVKLLRERCGVE